MSRDYLDWSRNNIYAFRLSGVQIYGTTEGNLIKEGTEESRRFESVLVLGSRNIYAWTIRNNAKTLLNVARNGNWVPDTRAWVHIYVRIYVSIACMYGGDDFVRRFLFHTSPKKEKATNQDDGSSNNV